METTISLIYMYIKIAWWRIVLSNSYTTRGTSKEWPRGRSVIWVHARKKIFNENNKHIFKSVKSCWNGSFEMLLKFLKITTGHCQKLRIFQCRALCRPAAVDHSNDRKATKCLSSPTPKSSIQPWVRRSAWASKCFACATVPGLADRKRQAPNWST